MTSCFVIPKRKGARIIAFEQYGRGLDTGDQWKKSGEVVTQISLYFQANNLSDDSIRLSAIRLARPLVRKRQIQQTTLSVRISIRFRIPDLTAFANPQFSQFHYRLSNWRCGKGDAGGRFHPRPRWPVVQACLFAYQDD
jgi:hypothetical protein